MCFLYTLYDTFSVSIIIILSSSLLNDLIRIAWLLFNAFFTCHFLKACSMYSLYCVQTHEYCHHTSV